MEYVTLLLDSTSFDLFFDAPKIQSLSSFNKVERCTFVDVCKLRYESR